MIAFVVLIICLTIFGVASVTCYTAHAILTNERLIKYRQMSGRDKL